MLGPVQPPIPPAFHPTPEGPGALWLHTGHQVELVFNGRIFDALVEEISRARSSIHLCIYIWRPGAVSDRLLQALHERAQAGVACRILVDAMGSRGGFQKEVRERLERAGCEVRRFHAPRLGEPRRLFIRNHRKLLVVDGRVGLTGGWCIADEWQGDGLHEDAWRDTNVRVHGPALAQMQASFSEDWQRAGGEPLPPDAFPPPAAEGTARASYIASFAGPGAEPAERMLREVFASARQRLWISSGYFILNEAFTRLLGRLKQAGVDVRVLVPGPINDIPAARAAQRSTYKALLAWGVRLWEYQPAMMHAKTALVDEQVSVIGSTNLDPFALNVLEEGSLVVEDPDLNAGLARAFLEDLKHALPVTRSRWYYTLLSLVRHLVWWVLRRFE